jgi:AraC family transcriptional activator of pobA
VDRDIIPQETRSQGFGDINVFRNLVEAHFRARWTARHYAEEMGITYDRLHDLCVRLVGKPPARLIRERSLHEARVLLQRTSLSSERIAAMLGFSSASQFNHFFKSMAGETPGAYRKQLLGPRAAREDGIAGFADWP